MKRLVSSCFFTLFLALGVMAQHGNEWIQFSQPYVKIPVAQDGMYRVSFQSLQQAGFPVSSDPRKFQLFHRGQEQAIHVEGESDGAFSSSDYIEFYGRRNDGTLDASLYQVPDHQPNPYYNLYSDTSAYFLTAGSLDGRRMSVHAGSPDGITPEVSHRAEKLLLLYESYSAGVDYGNVYKSGFDRGEGWMGVQINHGQEITYTIDGIVDIAPGSGSPTLEVGLVGRGPMMHDVEISAGGRPLSRVSFFAFESFKYSEDLAWSDIDASGKLIVKVRVTGSGGPDRVSAAYIRVTFPQQITMGGTPDRIFGIGASPEKKVLRISSAPANLRLFDLEDPAAPKRIATQFDGTLNAVIEASSHPRNILAASQVLPVTGLRRVTFRNIVPSMQDYVVISHRSLRKPALGYTDPVKAYAEYRSLEEGGGFDTLVLNIDQVYDQFNYGESSPRAIYQLMKFLATGQLPDYLFLIGKGLDVTYGYGRRPQAFTTYKDLVPTAGYPASDMLFSAGLGGTPNAPGVATGRLTANTPAEVVAYFNKIKERDASPYDDLNRKKILHLSGGIEESEPLMFRQILSMYQEVAEDLYLGGRVQPIAKQSTDIKVINIADEVNKGVGMITFFGHSAPNTLDFDIGLVTDPIMGYNNAGKYPFMLMNGCDAGSFFLNSTIIGENWVKTPAKGAIGYIAHSSYGLLFTLQVYASLFYDVAFGDSVFVRKGAGEVQREVARRFLTDYGSTPAYVSQAQQMVLLGDPALKIFGASKPDYAPVQESIVIKSFNDEPVTAFSDSFRIEIPVRNYGVSRTESMRIAIQRTFGAERVIEYDTIIPSVLFEDTLRMTVRNQDRGGYGINVFTIQVDADDLIDELDEANNTARFEFFIPLNSTRNLYPYNNSLVSKRDVRLSFQFTDLLSGPRDFLMEVDTTRDFNSPFKQSFALNGKVLVSQPITLTDRDSLVYFWRTKIAQPLENESSSWTVSSFTYIDDGPEGWAQLHFQQYENNAKTGLVSDPEVRMLAFQETVTDIAIRTFSASAGKPRDSVRFRINGAEYNLLYEGGACRNNTVNLVAFDRRSTQPYAGIYFTWYELLYQYGNRRLLCGREPYVINSFTPQELVTGKDDDLIRYVDNIASGDTVILFNLGNAGYANWPGTAKSKLGELGISLTQLDALAGGSAFVIFGRKGSPPGTAQIHVASSGALDVSRTIAGRFNGGKLSSGLIGPAQRWSQFVPKVKNVEDVDEFSFSILGVRPNGTEDTLRTAVHGQEDLSFIDAETYPHIRILFSMSDDINLTASQLGHWLVTYDPYAEGAVVYRSVATQHEVMEGATVDSHFGFVNVSDKTFTDSLIVRFEIFNEINGSVISERKISAPLPGDTTRFTLPFHTAGRGGLNDVQVFVNPRLLPEQTFDNNLLVLPGHVNVFTDNIGPVIDVSFDGRRLQDNDFVSANPEIAVKVRDENRFMSRTDTLGTKIFLARPCDEGDCPYEAIYFSRGDVAWTVAAESSEFDVSFTPQDLAEGLYRFRVEASDVKGNLAGPEPYEIHFRVEHDRSIVVSTPHPNPFTWQTNFEVVVTGEHENLIACRFQIATVNGAIVKEVSESSLHVGRNLITWDGTGGDGASLPGGIYFVRLTLNDGRSESTHYGKVILLR